MRMSTQEIHLQETRTLRPESTYIVPPQDSAKTSINRMNSDCGSGTSQPDSRRRLSEPVYCSTALTAELGPGWDRLPTPGAPRGRARSDQRFPAI